jgi:hypothetical protein
MIDSGIIFVDSKTLVTRSLGSRYSDTNVEQEIPFHLKERLKGGTSVSLFGEQVSAVLKRAGLDDRRYFRRRDIHKFDSLEELSESTLGKRLSPGEVVRVNLHAPTWISAFSVKQGRIRRSVQCTFDCPDVLKDAVDVTFKFDINGARPDSWTAVVREGKQKSLPQNRCRVIMSAPIPSDPNRPLSVRVMLGSAGQELARSTMSLAKTRRFIQLRLKIQTWKWPLLLCAISFVLFMSVVYIGALLSGLTPDAFVLRWSGWATIFGTALTAVNLFFAHWWRQKKDGGF